MTIRPCSLYAAMPYEMTSSAAGTPLRIAARTRSSTPRTGRGKPATYSSTVAGRPLESFIRSPSGGGTGDREISLFLNLTWANRPASRRSLLYLPNDPARIPRGEHTLGNVARDDAPGADDGARADADAGQDDSAAAHPDVGPNLDRLPELFTPPQFRVERVHGRINLHGRPEKREAADAHRAHVQDDAVEVEEDTFAELDVGAVIAEERRLHPDAVAAAAEQVAEDPPPLLLLRLARLVQGLAEVAR